MIKHAANILNQCQVREPGKSAYELTKGRAHIEPVAEFGEFVFFKPLKTKRESEHKDSWRDRFCEGFWIGSLFTSSENFIITAGGVSKAGAIKCKTQVAKWSSSRLDQDKFDVERPHRT